jgi:catechol 2,3-dioxygenase-like lactoylglutathione lyase family enzyme
MTPSPLIRTALMVRNLEASRAFYAAVVGLTQVFFEGDMTGSTAAHIIGVRTDSSIRAVIVKAPGVDYGMLGLFELSPDTPSLPRREGGLQLGETALVFYVEDLDHALAAVSERGGHIATPLQIFNKRREIAVRDPDGVAVNLIERAVSEAYQQRAADNPLGWPPKP